MSQYKNHFENESDLSSQLELYHFEQEIKIPDHKIDQLTHNQTQYNHTIEGFIYEGIAKIKIEQYRYGLIYLSEAERLLEYGASCGKIINRQLIIKTLHNQALCYQKLNEQNKTLKYVQAIIFNLKVHLKSLQSTPVSSKIQETHNSKDFQAKTKIYQRQIELAEYYLVFCSLNSQLGNRIESLEAGKKAIENYKAYFRQLKYTFKNQSIQMACGQQDQQLLGSSLKNLRLFRNEDNIEEGNIQKLVKFAKASIKKWNDRLKKSGGSSFDKFMSQYSIAQLVELKISDPTRQPKHGQVFTSAKTILKNLVNFSMGYFQIATEYRLLAEKKYFQSAIKFNSKQYSDSKINYLLSIIFVALHVPYRPLFMAQVISSFEYHYHIDLMKYHEVNSQIYLAELFESQETVGKSVKKSGVLKKKLRSTSKDSQLKSSKNKNKIKISHKPKQQQPTVADEYLIGSIKSNHVRKKRIISNLSNKSGKSQKSDHIHQNQKHVQESLRQSQKRLKRTNTVNRINHKKSENQLVEYGEKGTYNIEFDNKAVRKQRVRSSDGLKNGNKGLQLRIPNSQYPYLVGYSKEHRSPQDHKGKNGHVDPKKVRKTEKFRKSRQSRKSSGQSGQSVAGKLTKKKKVSKKQRAKQLTISNYYL